MLIPLLFWPVSQQWLWPCSFKAYEHGTVHFRSLVGRSDGASPVLGRPLPAHLHVSGGSAPPRCLRGDGVQEVKQSRSIPHSGGAPHAGQYDRDNHRGPFGDHEG